MACCSMGILRVLVLLPLLFYQNTAQQKSKLDLYIELLGRADDHIWTSLSYAANNTTATNSSLSIHIRNNISVEVGSSDLFHYVDSIQNKVVVFMETEPISYKSCIMSSLTGSPLVTLRTRPNDLDDIEQCRNIVSVSPDLESYVHAIESIIAKNSNWDKVIILYEMNEAAHMAHTRRLLTSRLSTIELLLVQNHPKETDDNLLNRIWHTIIDRKPQAIIPLVNKKFIRSLLQMETCSLKNPLTWLIQSEFHSNLTSSGQNIVIGFHFSMANWDKINHLKNAISLRSVEENVEEDALLAHDALVLIANATYDAMLDSRWNLTNSSPQTKTDLLKEYILKARIHGVTGDISINSHFVREVKELQVLNLLNNKPVQIGKWMSSAGTILSQKMYINFETDICKQPPLEGHTLRVTVLEVHPYVIKYNKSGSIAYKGFCIDLLDEMARDLKFKYVIEEVPDQQYGALIDGKWNGMIQQLIDKEVDISGAPLAITEVREKVVDFTIAYQHYTNDLLFSRPYNVYDMFAFIMPLSYEIWYCLAGTVLIVGVLTFLLNYLSPYGWKDENGQGTAKEMSLFNSVWFAFSCILQQGTSDRPKTLSGRVFSGVYWFCVLIFVSTYTANLTAFFTAKSATTTIKNLQDLIMDSEKDIGVLYASSSYSFFEHATYEQFQQLWSRMKTFPNSTQQAIEWAKNKNFVYIEASPIIEYAAAQNCDLMTAPGLSNTQGLAFALPQGSIYRDNMTLSLLRMEVSRFIQNRKDYWWSKNANCHEFNAGSLESKEVKVSHMLGVYVLFGCGCLLAIIALFAEILWDRRMRGKVATVPPESTNDIGTKAESPGNQSQHHTDLISLNSFS